MMAAPMNLIAPPDSGGPASSKLWGSLKANQMKLPELKARGSQTSRPPKTAPSPRLSGKGWQRTIDELKLQADLHVTTHESREKHQVDYINSYVGAMHAVRQDAAVQEESILALCQMINGAGAAAIRILVQSGGLDAIILAMRVHISESDIQQRAATALSQVAAVDNECRRMIVKIGGAKSLVAAMAMHSEMAILNDRCCLALLALAAGDENCKDVCIECGAIRAAASMMRNHPRSATVQATGCALFGVLASGNAGHKLDVVSQGGCLVIARAMEMHSNNVTVQMQGFTAIERLSEGDSSCVSTLVSSRCVTSVEKAIRRWPTDARMAHLGVTALANATKGERRTVLEVADARCLMVLNAVLRQHTDRHYVVERSLAAVCNLLSTSPQLIERVLQGGAMSAVRSAAMAHPTRAPVLEQACRCLLNAALGSATSKAFLVRQFCLRDVLLTSLRNHQDTATLVDIAISALANLAAGNERPEDEEQSLARAPAAESRGVPIEAESRPNTSHSRSRPGTSQDARSDEEAALHATHMANVRQGLIDYDAAGTVTMLMRKHNLCYPVVEEGVAFIRNFAAGDDACRDAIIEAEGVSGLIKAMRKHAGSEALAVLGCLGLRNMCSGTTKQITSVVSSDGIEAVLSVLVRHMGSTAVVQAGLAALRNLAVDSWAEYNDAPRGPMPLPAGAVSVILESDDGVSTIVEAMKTHLDNATVQLQGCGALRNLACGVPGNAELRILALEAIAMAGGIEAIGAALKYHPRVARVQAQGCAAYRNMACGDDMDRRVLGSDALLEAAVSAMQSHPRHAETQLQACALLVNLTAAPPKPRDQCDEAAWHGRCEAVEAVAMAAAAKGAFALHVGTLRSHLRNAAVVAEACTSLYSILSRPLSVESKRALATQLSDDEVQTIVDVGVQFVEDACVLGPATLILCEVAHTLPAGQKMNIRNPDDLSKAVVLGRTRGRLSGVGAAEWDALMRAI